MPLFCCLLALALQVPAPSSAAASVPALRLERGLKLLEMQEYEAARPELELALAERDYRLEQVVALYRALGVVRAFAGDDAGARWAFERLLSVDPGHALRYTLSPKATFLFEQARQTARARRALELSLATAPVVPFDQPIEVTLDRAADPLALVTRVQVLHRVKGSADWQQIDLAAPAIGGRQRVALPAVAADQAVAEADGTRGALLELAAIGYSDAGWEVVRSPAPDRPHELPVGFDVPGPWYAQWWLWGLVGGGLAAVATGATVAWLLWPLPEQINATYRVVP